MPENLHPYNFSIDRKQREQLLGQKGHVLWLFGLSGSGKSTIADALAARLHQDSRFSFVLDGDVLRKGLNKDLGFSDEDRAENLRRAAEVAKVLCESGMIVIVSFITPLETNRKLIRSILGDADLSFVFVDCPLERCEERDPKSLYKKARKGEIPNFTGVSAPFEATSSAEIRIDSENESVDSAVDKITSYLTQKSLLK